MPLAHFEVDYAWFGLRNVNKLKRKWHDDETSIWMLTYSISIASRFKALSHAPL